MSSNRFYRTLVSIVVPLQLVLCTTVCYAQPNTYDQQFPLKTCLESGMNHFRQGEFSTAILYFDRARLLAPDRSDISYYLGACHDKTGDKRNATRFYDECAKLDPNGAFGSAAVTAKRDMLFKRQQGAIALHQPSAMPPVYPQTPQRPWETGGQSGAYDSPAMPAAAAPAANEREESLRRREEDLRRREADLRQREEDGRLSAQAQRDQLRRQALRDDRLRTAGADDDDGSTPGTQRPANKPYSADEKITSVITGADKHDRQFARTLDRIKDEAQIEANNAQTNGDAGANDVRTTARRERERLKQQLSLELSALEQQRQSSLRSGSAYDAAATQTMADWVKRRTEQDMKNADEIGEFKAQAYAKWKSARQESITNSALNLLDQIQERKQHGGFGLQTVGTNLYARQYGSPTALLPPVHPSVVRIFPAGSPDYSPGNYLIPEDAPRFPPQHSVRGAILKDVPEGKVAGSDH